MNASLIEVSLGALLHDVGKFLQRVLPGEDALSEQSRRMREQTCPVHQGRSSHAHILFTNEFFAEDRYWPPGVRQDVVANLAAFHHRPDTAEQNMVAKADRLASGMDRREAEEPGRGRIAKARMRSVAAGASPQGAGVQAAVAVARLSPEGAFPHPLVGDPASWDAEDQTGNFRRLWGEFLEEWAQNQCPDPLGFANRGASVMERFFWCVPSAVHAFPDISLYDHSAATAAIAGCLFEAEQADGEADSPFLLVAGDLTGIQGYVFALRHGAGGLARRLRARSFDVMAWSETFSLGILGRLGLPLVHRILFAGGKFHLLLPNVPAARQALDEARGLASDWLFDRSGGQLGLSLASLPVGDAGLMDFSQTLAELQDCLMDERDRPGRHALIRGGAWEEGRFALPPIEAEGEEKVCPCCRLRLAEVAEGDEGRRAVCWQCHDDGERGRRLPKMRFAYFSSGPLAEPHVARASRPCAVQNGPKAEVLQGIHGRDAHATIGVAKTSSGNGAGWEGPLGRFGLAGSPAECPPGAGLVLDMDGAGGGPPALPTAGGWRARHVPVDAGGDVLDFSKMAEASQGRLGYLKMDVDDLGFLMQRGLRGGGQDRAALSRVATLSRSLEVFFAGFLETLLRNEFPDVYLVYSGGDDVLAVGPWPRAFELALRLREEFGRYVAGNPAWTLSAGVAVVHCKTPVLAAVAEAEELLKFSKSAVGGGVVPFERGKGRSPAPPGRGGGRARGSPAKDRITALGASAPWGGFARALQAAKRLHGWLESDAVNTSQVRRLLAYSSMYREFQRTGDTRQFEYAPLLAYDIRRNWAGGGAEREEAKRWAAALRAPDSPDMKMLHFVCQYALCAARETGEE